MNKPDRYIQWQGNPSNSMDEKVAEIMKHWQHRYELGSAVLLSQTPATTLKSALKHWRRLTRQLQKIRQDHQTAEDLLATTRLISRMQRVTFSTNDPSVDPDATFYILQSDTITSLPTRCYTLYSLTHLADGRILQQLAPEALAVLYMSKQPVPNLRPKTELESAFKTMQTSVDMWLHKHHITLTDLDNDLEKTNQALDTLLSSANTQAEFLHQSQMLLHALQLAQPINLSSDEQSRITTLEKLQKHVQLLSSSYISDHVLESDSSDSFLLHDIGSANAFGQNSLDVFIKNQRQAGRHNLAAALEHTAGFIRI